MSMNWKALLAKLRAIMFHEETKEEEYNARLILGTTAYLQRLREMINGEWDILMFHTKCDLSEASVQDIVNEGVVVGHGDAKLHRPDEVTINPFIPNSNFRLTDDFVSIGLLSEERMELILMPKCDIFCFHSCELNIFIRQIPIENHDKLAAVVLIPIKTERL